MPASAIGRRTRLARAIALALALALVGAANAGGAYRMDWSTLDAGGEIDLAGGPWQLSATLGQVDAQALGPMTGGAYALQGGFWAGVPAVAGPTSDALFANGFEAPPPAAATAAGSDRP